ncbi:hypothetical protein [Pseudomonas aeruginosa]|uniref:hypothetical protein n=1 Tax=Pseudomonas aeruginosa TaxID=287 RepID=UPI000ACAAAEB|nr:hypothetical protein [Pseudomonas aeruginosa]
MSSTQHQLIEQCATRLRGIVEALDNIHDSTQHRSPHRWSTDLDDVHSSAESLLALIKDQAPVRSEASFEEWLANELEGEDGQPVPAAVCDIALARRAFNHWPKLEHPAKVGGVRFSAGVSSRLVVEAAQRLNEFESTPEQEAERPEVVAYRTIGRHTKHQHPHYALNYYKQNAEDQAAHWRERGCEVSEDELMTVSQHERIVGALRAENAQLRQHKNDYMDAGQETYRALQNEIREREAEIARLDGLVSGRTAERDAALARVAELEHVLQVVVNAADHGSWPTTVMYGIEKVREVLAGSGAPSQAQHSVPDGTSDLCRFLAKLYCELDGLRYSTAKLPAEQIADALIFKWPVLQGARNQLNIKRISEQPYDESKLHSAIAAMLAAAPGKEVPQAWLDVQAERRRQVEAEGWTPEHDDKHSHGQMARAAACYALAGSSAPSDGTAALLVSLAWPWDEQWWKPSTARRDLVKACALALAEIERLDRAGISQSPQPGATTASS